MGKLNRVPVGFLDLLDDTAQGKTPPQYADFVQPELDATELYLASSLAVVGQDNTHSSAPTVFTIDVPNDEAWVLRAASVIVTHANIAQGEEWRLSVGLLPRTSSADTAGSPRAGIWSSKFLDVVIANDSASDSHFFPRLITIPGGSRVFWEILERDTAPARTTQCTLLVDVLASS